MLKKNKLLFILLILLFLTATFTGYTFAEEPRVTLSISPAGESDAGEDLVFTATVDGFDNPEYQFGYRSVGGRWTAMAPGTENTFTTSTPAGFAGGEFELGVRVREFGTGNWLMNTVFHTINPVEPAVTLTVTPAGESELGDSVTLEASSKGVTNPEFLYGRKYTGGSWATSESSSTVVSYTPTRSGTMDFAVRVREAGTGAYLDTDIISHQVNDNGDEEPLDTPVINYDQARKVDEIIGLDGGEISLSDASGNRFTLIIPKDAIIGQEEVSMIPVRSITNFPMSGDLIGGVGMQPDGLSLLKPATLVVRPSDSAAITKWLQAAGNNRLSGYMHGVDGKHLHFYPLTVKGNEFHFQITCLRGLGLGLATAGDNEKQLNQPSVRAAITANRAAAAIYSDLATRQLLGSGSAAFTSAEKAALTQIYNRWFDEEVGPLTRQGEQDDEMLDRGIIEYLDWLSALEQADLKLEANRALPLQGLEAVQLFNLQGQRNQEARNSLVKGIDNAVSYIYQANIPAAASAPQGYMSNLLRHQRWTAVTDILGLTNFEKTMEELKRRSQSGPRFEINSTTTLKEVYQISVASDPIQLTWTADWRSQKGSGAIRHTDFCWCDIEHHTENAYVSNYILTPGTVNLEVFWPSNQLRIDVNGNWNHRFPTSEDYEKRMFANIIIMGIEATIVWYIEDEGPFYAGPAPFWLGSFSAFHQDKIWSGGMMFREWKSSAEYSPYNMQLIFEQQMDEATESTEMTIISNR